ncbi:rhodanese-like domain-containing protein [Streptomyces sp. GSL17-111]|uniref:rhodanese-like domain-containing protein n=1 Tax=Streptomyces sp. GSL17-111 TaxID=3121596 RepID=UPI0030F4A348
MNHAPIPSVDVRDVPADAFLLDVREPDEWAAGRAEGALHVPIGEIVGRAAEVTERAGDDRVYVVCRVGGRSAQVTQFLVAQGVDAVNVDGGMLSWAAAGRPMTGDADPAHVL